MITFFFSLSLFWCGLNAKKKNQRKIYCHPKTKATKKNTLTHSFSQTHIHTFKTKIWLIREFHRICVHLCKWKQLWSGYLSLKLSLFNQLSLFRNFFIKSNNKIRCVRLHEYFPYGILLGEFFLCLNKSAASHLMWLRWIFFLKEKMKKINKQQCIIILITLSRVLIGIIILS